MKLRQQQQPDHHRHSYPDTKIENRDIARRIYRVKPVAHDPGQVRQWIIPKHLLSQWWHVLEHENDT